MEEQQQFELDLLFRLERKIVRNIFDLCEEHRNMVEAIDDGTTKAERHEIKLLMDMIDAMHERLKLIREDIERLV